MLKLDLTLFQIKAQKKSQQFTSIIYRLLMRMKIFLHLII